MVKKAYKPTMLTLEAYNVLDKARRDLRTHSAARVTFNDVINEFVKKQLVFYNLEPSIKEHIRSFVSEVSRASALKGVILFGSVAKGNHGEYSDIDLFMMVEGNELAFYRRVVRPALNSIWSKREAISGKGPHLNISPLIVSVSRLKFFSPIFLDILDYGLVLYDRDDTASDFLDSLRKIKHKRTNIAGAEVLEWR